MINYIEKGPGLHEAIAAAGYSLYELNGSWVCSNEAAVQKIIDEYDPRPELVEKIKQAATQAIDTAYPLYKQLNLQADNSYAQNAIAGLTGLAGDEVMQRAVSKVGLTDDPAALKATRDQVQELDLADIMADIPDRLALAFPPAQVQFMANLIDGYFRTLVVCICGYRLIRLVRTWSNSKEAELATITDLADLEAFDPTAGCPDIR